MLYKIEKIEKKKVLIGGLEKELIDGTFSAVDGTTVEATIWKEGKDGQFPNFDGLVFGATFEGNAWTSPKNGKVTIYPPSKKTGGNANVSKMMDKKNESIEKFQGNKEESIKASSTFRDATLITLEFSKKNPTMSELAFNQKWLEIRKWLHDNYEIGSNDIPF